MEVASVTIVVFFPMNITCKYVYSILDHNDDLGADSYKDYILPV